MDHDWDDTALLQAYDAAVLGTKLSSKSSKPPSQPQPQPSSKRAKTAPSPTAPAPTAPHLDQIQDEALKPVLQAYFAAGFALGQYLGGSKE